MVIYSSYHVSFTNIFLLKDLTFGTVEVIFQMALFQVSRIKGPFSWDVIWQDKISLNKYTKYWAGQNAEMNEYKKRKCTKCLRTQIKVNSKYLKQNDIFNLTFDLFFYCVLLCLLSFILNAIIYEIVMDQKEVSYFVCFLPHPFNSSFW